LTNPLSVLIFLIIIIVAMIIIREKIEAIREKITVIRMGIVCVAMFCVIFYRFITSKEYLNVRILLNKRQELGVGRAV